MGEFLSGRVFACKSSPGSGPGSGLSGCAAYATFVLIQELLSSIDVLLMSPRFRSAVLRTKPGMTTLINPE